MPSDTNYVVVEPVLRLCTNVLLVSISHRNDLYHNRCRLQVANLTYAALQWSSIRLYAEIPECTLHEITLFHIWNCIYLVYSTGIYFAHVSKCM